MSKPTDKYNNICQTLEVVILFSRSPYYDSPEYQEAYRILSCKIKEEEFCCAGAITYAYLVNKYKDLVDKDFMLRQLKSLEKNGV